MGERRGREGDGTGGRDGTVKTGEGQRQYRKGERWDMGRQRQERDGLLSVVFSIRTQADSGGLVVH